MHGIEEESSTHCEQNYLKILVMLGTFLDIKQKHSSMYQYYPVSASMLPSFALLKSLPLCTVTHLGVTINGVWIGELDSLTTCTHSLELKVITGLLLISTLYKSVHTKSSPAFSVFTSSCLVIALNNGDSYRYCPAKIP
jgi:hypothetical protein